MEIQNTSEKNRGESFQHLKIKRYFMKNLPQYNDIKLIREEVNIGNRIADIFCQLTNNKKIVIEVQHSMILVKEIIQRIKDYNQHDCYVLWVFNASSFDRWPKNENAIQILSFEKECHKLYHGRVYYINVEDSGFHTPLYPLHFTIYHEEKRLPIGFEYYRKSRSRRSIILGNLEDLKLKLFKNNGLSLARFNDENVRDKCFKEISLFLENQSFIVEINTPCKSNLDKEKLLCSITGKFGDRYGVDLIYDVLKQRIKMDINGLDLHVMKSYFNYHKNNINLYLEY